jgi:hypothetical protein
MRHQYAGLTALTLVIALSITVAACDSGPEYAQFADAPTAAAHQHQQPPGTSNASAELNRELAALRRVVAPLHNFERAQAAGWSAQITPCLELPGVGGMGFHYGNPTYLGDGGAVSVTQPEALLFEPTEDGQMRFVGVEYIVPFTDVPPTGPAPVLFGLPFEAVTGAGVWGLHAWVGRHNPDGMFTAWNPMVSCEFAAP